MSGGGGGGGGFNPGKIINNLPGMPGFYDKKEANIAGGTYGPQDDNQRKVLRDKVTNDLNLDEDARKDLLGQLDQNGSDPVALEQRYQQILDPQTKLGKDMLGRKTRKGLLEAPGLKQQTSFGGFLGGGDANPFGSILGGFLGGR